MCWIRELRVTVSVLTSWQLSMRTPQPRSTIWRQQTQIISSKVGKHCNICHLRWRVHLNSNMLVTSIWVKLKCFYGTIPRNLHVLISFLFAICEQIVMWCRVWDVLSADYLLSCSALLDSGFSGLVFHWQWKGCDCMHTLLCFVLVSLPTPPTESDGWPANVGLENDWLPAEH